ncbi:MAG: hypothetical protein OER95_17250, partial [Acidimicrobiia bacterium]|nr:hypothetical protein [Acidimicrobiia bacterium]
TVNYLVSGTAGNGIDYTTLTGSVVIPGGQASATETVAVIDDGDGETSETVVVTIDPAGTYTVGTPASDTVTITDDDGVNVLEVRISSGLDDVEERASGSMSLTSSDLELVDDNTKIGQTVGVRFPGIGIPQGATVLRAWIQFQTDETDSGQTDLTIRAENSDTASAFVNVSGNVSSRPVTNAFALWSPPAWDTVGEAGPDQQTPELSAVVQEVLDRPGWSSGNALAFIVTGAGERTAEAYNGVPAAAPLLHIEYTTGPVANRPPVATDDATSAVEETLKLINVIANDFDPDGNLDPTTTNTACATCALPAFGTLVNNGNGMFEYTPFAGSAPNIDTFVYEVCDDENACDTARVDITIVSINAPTVFETRVGSSSDDAEERPSGSVSLNSSDLELIQDKNNQQVVGVRFTGIEVPQGATITNAWIQFQTDETDTIQTDLTIRAQDSDDTATFVNSSGNISSRPVTTANVPWSPLAWTIVGEAGDLQKTPNISAPIQAVVNRAGWTNGNSMVIIFTGSGSRTAESYDGFAAAAPLIHIEYTTP